MKKDAWRRMFDLLIWLVFAVGAIGAVYAYAGSRDVFHPLLYLAPMCMFLYGWMPLKLNANGGLDGFFQYDQLIAVQCWNLAGIVALVFGALSSGCRLPISKPPAPLPQREAEPIASALARGSLLCGGIGLSAWMISIINVGGLHEAFSRPYSGGWDDSGYIRDGALLMFPGFLLASTALLCYRFRISYLIMAAAFIIPWMIQALYTTRRGPTVMITIVVSMTWYLCRSTRPPLLMTAGAAGLVGLLMLFLVSNRGAIYMGSDQEVSTDVSNIVEKPDAGNEYIYGAGTMLSAEQRETFFWGRRYLAQILVRPIPSSIWPNKYEDVGLGELTRNAGTGEGLNETMGWEGANGAAPGVVADIWLEFRWFTIPALWVIGRLYSMAWRRAVIERGPWIGQYVVISALSIYLVMQTMEAVIFRLLLMSIPVWLTWRAAGPLPKPASSPARKLIWLPHLSLSQRP
jgi:hypothetical protein